VAFRLPPLGMVMRGEGDLHEILAILVETGDLKNIEDVMHVKLRKPIWQHRTREIGVAMEIKIVSREHIID
jgi:hypothetical protein